jgi:hypothetical protein
MTPWEVRQEVRAYGRRLASQHRLHLSAAWHTEAFARTKQLPDLNRVLGTPPKPQTNHEMASNVMAWVSAMEAKGQVIHVSSANEGGPT